MIRRSSQLLLALASVLLAGALLGARQSGAGTPPLVRDRLPEDFGLHVPYGLAQKLDPPAPARQALGRALFFDGALSDDGSLSCAGCHLPEHGFADSLPLSRGVHGHTTKRNAPSLVNRALGQSFFWDGRAATLEEQVLQPIENPDEMGATLDAVLARLAGHEATALAFKQAFPDGLTRANLATALASFVRSIWIGDSPVDRFQASEFEALSVPERLGLWLYESKAGCWRCHSGPNFSDEKFHDSGIGAKDDVPEEGRFAVTHDEADRGRFKTPTLRGVASSAPYMHDGSLATLPDVIAFYRRGGNQNRNLDPNLTPLELSEADEKNLIAFLEALSRTAPTKR